MLLGVVIHQTAKAKVVAVLPQRCGVTANSIQHEAALIDILQACCNFSAIVSLGNEWTVVDVGS